jgi:serine/threonine protein kinase
MLDMGIEPTPPDCPYDLLARIGSGGCADVYSAIHPDRPLEPVAVKVQKPGPIAQQRFRREIDILRRLDHPHVMPLIEAGSRDDWYAMPLADGTLQTFRDANPSDWDGLRISLSGICGALLHAHANGVVHRDGSPCNILWTPGSHGPHWLLSDFGLARTSHSSKSLTPTGALFGTPGFAAPEIHHDPRMATPLSDAYSIGAIARWFTNISLDQSAPSAPGRYWSKLIRSTVAFEPDKRWPVTRIARYLEVQPTSDRVLLVGNSPARLWDAPFCTRCGARVSHDGAGRCTRCGFMDEL